MSKYDRDSADVYAVKRLGDEIGYGHLMALAHELWARHLEEKGLPREGALCAVGYPRIKDEYQAYAINDPIYKVVVERALADTPQTDFPTEWCETCELWQDNNCKGVAECKRNIEMLTELEKLYEADTPQTDSVKEVKDLVNEQTDCPWKGEE